LWIASPKKILRDSEYFGLGRRLKIVEALAIVIIRGRGVKFLQKIDVLCAR